METIATDFYAIEADIERSCLRLRFEPIFWDMSVVERLFKDVMSCTERMPDPCGIRTVVDLRNAILQSGDVIATVQNALINHTAGQIALVASNALARMQTKRLQVRDGIRYFASIEQAEGWLFDEPFAAQLMAERGDLAASATVQPGHGLAK